MAKKGTKKRDGVQSGCFANLNLLPFCRSRCRRRRRLPKLPTDGLWSQSWTIRAFLHGGGGPSVGGVTRLSIQSLILMWSRLHVRWGNPPHVTSPTWGPPPSCKQALNRFHSRGQHLCKFIGTKEIVYIRKEFNSHRIDLEHQYGRRFIVLEHPYGRRDVMWLYVIGALPAQLSVGRFWYDWWVSNFGQIYNLEVTLGTSKALFTLNTRESGEKSSCYCKISSVLVLFFLKLNNVINRLCSAQLKSPSKTWNWEQKSL